MTIIILKVLLYAHFNRHSLSVWSFAILKTLKVYFFPQWLFYLGFSSHTIIANLYFHLFPGFLSFLPRLLFYRSLCVFIPLFYTISIPFAGRHLLIRFHRSLSSFSHLYPWKSLISLELKFFFPITGSIL